MIDFKLTKRALEMAAVAADHWPIGHGYDWGKTIDGQWTNKADHVAEFG